MKWILLTAVGLAASGCVSATGTGPERLKGHYAQGFELDGFTPCGSEESWWVTSAADLRTRYQALGPAQYEPVYVELHGSAGPRGAYGHLGAYTRELAVSEVLAIRKAAENDCR